MSESGSSQGTAVYIQLSSFCSRMEFHLWILQYNRLQEKFTVISSMTLCIPVQNTRSFRGSKCETGIGTVLTAGIVTELVGDTKSQMGKVTAQNRNYTSLSAMFM